MNMEALYQFRAERIEAQIADHGDQVDEYVLEERWQDLVTDGSESAVLLTEASLALVSNVLAGGACEGPDPRYSAWHADALERLGKHDGCVDVVNELRATRDDVLASILHARNYVFSDIYEGEWGDLYVDVEPFLRYLRPTLPGGGRYMRLDVVEDECSVCLQRWGHEDWCDVEETVETLAERREHAIASHLHCAEMGMALVAHTIRCLDQVEKIALVTSTTKDYVEGQEVFGPRGTLSAMTVADLNVGLQPRTAGALATFIYPPLVDLPYCGEGQHSDPHRACRYLVS